MSLLFWKIKEIMGTVDMSSLSVLVIGGCEAYQAATLCILMFVTYYPTNGIYF